MLDEKFGYAAEMFILSMATAMVMAMLVVLVLSVRRFRRKGVGYERI